MLLAATIAAWVLRVTVLREWHYGPMAGSARRPLVMVSGNVEAMPSGDYLAANTLVDTTGCSATNVIAWNGTSFACSAAAGGITNGAGANVITKSNGTNLVASSISDDGTTVSVNSGQVTITEANGNLATAGTLKSTSDLAVNTNKFTVTASNGNTAVAGTLGVTGLTTATGGITSTAATNTLGNFTTATITPASFSTIQNDYAGCGANATICRLNCTAGSCDFTGISGGVDGRHLLLESIGTGNIVFYHQNTNSTTPADRFILSSASTTTMLTSGLMEIIYDGAQSRWIIDHQWTGNNWLGNLIINGSLGVTGSITSVLHVAGGGSAPTPSSCGTGASVTGTDLGMKIATGTGGTTCTVTFANAYSAAPACVVTGTSNANPIPSYSVSTTAITFTSTVASSTYYAVCIGA